jgi:hypothetical protein
MGKNEYTFLTDAMLGKLTVLLRIFGYDTIYAHDLYTINLPHSSLFPNPLPDPIPDDILLHYAKLTTRILLTKDYPFYKKNKKNIFYLEGKGVYNYLKQLKEEFGLEYTFEMERARCSTCNSRIEKVSDKSSIKNLVKKSTYSHYENFYQCINPNCKKVFWNGPHIKNIKEKLEKHLLNN